MAARECALSTSSLLGLPDEILERILSELSSYEDIKTIHSVLLTCKQLYSIVLPLSVAVFHVYKTPGVPLCYQTAQRRTYQFLRYIAISKPHLADHVRVVAMREWPSPGSSGDSFGLTAPPTDDMIIYRAIVEKRVKDTNGTDEDAREWIDDLEKGDAYSVASIFWNICPNLVTWHIDGFEDS